MRNGATDPPLVGLLRVDFRDPRLRIRDRAILALGVGRYSFLGEICLQIGIRSEMGGNVSPSAFVPTRVPTS